MNQASVQKVCCISALLSLVFSIGLSAYAAESAPKPAAAAPADSVGPARTEVVQPIHNDSFDQNGKARKRQQGGNPRHGYRCVKALASKNSSDAAK